MLKALFLAARKGLFLFALVVGLYTTACQYAMAQSTPVIPDIGADMGDTIDAVGEGIGPFIKQALLVAAAILIVRVAWKWLKSGAKA